MPLMKVIPHGTISKRRIDRQLEKIEKTLDELSFKPDVIIAHWVNPQIQLLLPLKEKYNAIASLVIHTDCSTKNIRRFNMIEIAKGLDAIGCRNSTEAEYVKKALFLEHMPFICYSGIPDNEAEKYINRLKNQNLDKPQEKEFIYVGRLVKYKNVDVIIKALSIAFPDKKYRLHVVGDGAEMESLKALDQELTGGTCTVFHGQLSREDVFSLMERCKCFIMVSNNETFGMVYLEAMLAGCLTIASEKGGIDGVIVDGVNGFLSKQGDVDALVLKLKHIESLTQEQYESVRDKSINTAYEYRDSSVAKKYLEDVLYWKR
jgi:glycosyltransferase involved in cell wall biosynthesis